MDTKTTVNLNKLPLGLKIAAGYMVLAGVTGLIWPLIDLGPQHPEFSAQSFAYKLGAYFRGSLFDIIYLASGIGLFLKKSWAKKLALTILVVSAIYTGNAFAWGYAGGKPSTSIYLASILVAGIWNGIWFYLIFRNKTLAAQESLANHTIKADEI